LTLTGGEQTKPPLPTLKRGKDMKEKSPSPKEPTFYDQLCSVDIISPIVELWQGRRITASMDGKFSTPEEINLVRAWIISKICPERSCSKWLSIYHRFYQILPPPCKNCWKVVMAPQTVAELIEIQQLQDKLGWPGKTGLEQRDYTSGLGGYRAFWYCPFTKGLEGGRVHFKRVRKALEEIFGGEKIAWYIEEEKLYLKRGCTELERDFGPSDQWDSIDHSAKFNLLETVWETPPELKKEFSPLIYTNYRRWIEFAIAYGDPSVSQYIGGGPLGVQSVKYQDSAHFEGDFKPSIEPLNGSIEPLEEGKDGNGGGAASPQEEDLFGFESSKG